MNVRIMDEDTTSTSFVVLWDKVVNIFTITYTVTWSNEIGMIGMDTVNSPSYTVNGLTANTSYYVTVVANNRCGAGPVSGLTMAMTNGESPTSPPSNITVYVWLLEKYTQSITCQSINHQAYTHMQTHALHTHIHTQYIL